MELAAGDYVRYKIGKRPNELKQKMDFVSFEDILEKVPPPEGVRIQRDVTNP